jgi:DNA-binding transcriptional LysR family regulator
VDLNLYPVFLEIMRHRSVSRAAEALGLTQPAASNALTRLRQQLGDPLFVRSGNGMLPTRHARDIAPAIGRAVDALRETAEERARPAPPLAGIRRHFTLVMSDLEETLFLPELIDALSTEAPEVTTEVRPFRRDTLRQDLENRRIDFILAHLPTTTKNVISRDIARQEFVCVARSQHPGLGNALSLEQYVTLGHILVAPDQGGRRGLIDETLASFDRRRRVVCSVPHFLLACLLAARTEYLLTIPRLLAERAAADFDLDIHELPFPAPGFKIGLHWHATREGDLEHASLGQFILGLLVHAG